jgi:[acyl-carrier-protein] S-malonyltransferase
MKAYVFPGQGAQFEGMGKDLYEQSELAREMFHKADEIVGFSLSKIMFEGSAEDLKETRITQPAMYLYPIIKAKMLGDAFKPEAVAGHSLGECTALVAAGVLSFEDGMRLVNIRANAVQKACDLAPGTMAAILMLDDEVVEKICAEVNAAGDIVVAANYNCPGQLVISGTHKGVELASAKLAEAGARVVPLAVGGAFHSPLMEPARAELAAAIETTTFNTPSCAIYQNVDAKPCIDPAQIKANLIAQLTAPVRWTQTVQNMLADGVTEFAEVGGKVLQGMIKKVNRQVPTETL